MDTYLPIIIERAGDKSHIVRKKVIQTLSLIMERHSKEDVLKILLLKWQDSSAQVRDNIVRCLGKIFKNKAEKSIEVAFNFIRGIICCIPISQPYGIEVDSERNQSGQTIWREVFVETAVR